MDLMNCLLPEFMRACFAFNKALMTVFEKNGYVKEGFLKMLSLKTTAYVMNIGMAS